MFELEINAQVYHFNLGLGFLREINKTTTVPVKDIPGKVTNMGMQYAFAELLDGNVETLCDVLYIANKSQSPRLTKTDIDTYIDDEGTNIDALFDQVIDFLKNTNATKKETQTVLKRVTEAQEQEKQKNQEK